MKKTTGIVALFATAVLGPAAALGVLGFRSLREDEATRKNEVDARVRGVLKLASDEIASDLAEWREGERRRIEAALAGPSRPPDVVALLNVHGEPINPPPAAAEPPPLEDQLLQEQPDLEGPLRRAVELDGVRDDPAGAMRLYQELAASLDHPATRARLIDRALRAAIRARKSAEIRALGRQLIEEYPRVAGESGIPLGALARLHLLEEAGPDERGPLIRALLDEPLDPVSRWLVLRRIPGEPGEEVAAQRRIASVAVEAQSWARTGERDAWLSIDGAFWAALRVPHMEAETGEPRVAIAVVRTPPQPRETVEHKVAALSGVAGISVGVKNAGAWVSAPLERWDCTQEVAGTPLLAVALLRDRSGMEREAGARQALWSGLVLLLLVVMAGGFAWTLVAVRREMALTHLKADFISSVSHELRTPLTSIRMFSELTASPSLTDETRRGEYLGLIRREAERLSSLVERLLDFARLERGKRAFVLVASDLRAVTRSAVEAFQSRHEAHRFGLILPGTPVGANVDASAIEQAIHNLLDNAVKYAREVPRVEIGVETSAGSARIWIRDHGPGIDPAERQRLFERFFRGKDGRERGIPGTGLGLSIVHEIMEAHGGRVRAEFPEAGGTLFVLEFPS